SAEVTIQARSIDTRNEDRDAHLRSNDFFAMEKYPEITFATTKVEPVDDSTFRVTGDLTVRGETRPITMEVEHTGAAIDPWDNLRVGFEGSVTVNRKDWGINWNAALEAGGVLVSEKATLEFEVSAFKQS
ncbi:MAG: YceI family protein, partial [Acidimicrobiia bacterium]